MAGFEVDFTLVHALVRVLHGLEHLEFIEQLAAVFTHWPLFLVSTVAVDGRWKMETNGISKR